MVAGITPRGDGSTVVAQLESDLVLGEVILFPRRGGSNDIGGRAGGRGEDDERCVSSGRGGRFSILNVPITQLKRFLCLSVD